MKTWLNKSIEQCYGNGQIKTAPAFRSVDVLRTHKNDDVTVMIYLDVRESTSMVTTIKLQKLRIASEYITSLP